MIKGGKIERIHTKRLARTRALYKENNKFYIGQDTGLLKIEEYQEGDVTGTTLRTKVSRVGDYTTAELMLVIAGLLDSIDELNTELDELEAEFEAYKCKSIGLMIALG